MAGNFLGVDVANAGRPFGGIGPRQGSAHATVELHGITAVIGRMVKLSGASRRAMGVAMELEMQGIIKDAKESFVPIDTGNTKDSGKVLKPQIHRSYVDVIGKFGPVRNPRGSKYTIPLHEIPEPPATSVGGRSAHHDHGSWKFLQIPFLIAFNTGMHRRISNTFHAVMTAMGKW